MSSLSQQLRAALRSLGTQPGFSSVVILTLGLGIGASSLVFTVVNSVLLSPLPYADPGRLVRLYQFYPDRPERGYGYVVGIGFQAYREVDDVFEGLATLFTYRQVGADLGGDRTERVMTMPISAGLVEMLGLQPALGREFRREEENGDVRVAMISYALWQRRFNASGEVIGQPLDLDGIPYAIVGIMPAGFRSPVGWQVDVWTPEDLQSGRNAWYNNYLSVVGRLRPGVTIEQANRGLDDLSARLAEEDPGAEGITARVLPLLDDTVGRSRSMLYMLSGAVGLFLLISCVNVAGLFLVRSLDRQRDLAIRAALGAGRGRLTSELLLESLVLAVSGGIVGLVLAFLGVRMLLAWAPDLPRLPEVGVDPRALGFALAATLATGVLFGSYPALRLSRPDLANALGQDQRTQSASRGQRRLRGLLAVGEVALAVVLLVGAGLLIKSFAALTAVDTGIRADNVLTYEVHLPSLRYREPADRIEFHDRLIEAVERIPAVEAAGAISYLPIEGRYHRWSFGRPDVPDDQQPDVPRDNRMVQGGYFATLGIQLRRGRLFDRSDTAASENVVIINRFLAERAFADRDPVGAEIRQMGRTWRVVGVVANTAHTPQGEVVGKVYYPHSQFAWNRNWALSQVVRTSGDPSTVLEQVRDVLHAIDPELVLYRPRTMEEILDQGVSPQRFATAVLSVFGALAFLLAVVGVYGVLARSVAQRTSEFGIRMALGARQSVVRQLVWRQALVLAGTGVLTGILAALGLGRWLSSQLFGVSSTDPTVFVPVALSVVAAACVAAAVPAYRATSVSPSSALTGRAR